MKETKKIYVSLTEEQCRTIQRLADESCRTRTGYIRKIITVYLRYIEQNPDQKIS